LFENEKKEKKRKRSYYRQRHMRSVPAARRWLIPVWRCEVKCSPLSQYAPESSQLTIGLMFKMRQVGFEGNFSDYHLQMYFLEWLCLRTRHRVHCHRPRYTPIAYYWTAPLILDQAYLVGNLTKSKIAETKAPEHLKSWHFCISNFRTC
jgi:hypothetical protein